MSTQTSTQTTVTTTTNTNKKILEFCIENDTMGCLIKYPDDREQEFLTMVNASKACEKNPSSQYNFVVGKAEEMGLDFKESYIEHDW